MDEKIKVLLDEFVDNLMEMIHVEYLETDECKALKEKTNLLEEVRQNQFTDSDNHFIDEYIFELFIEQEYIAKYAFKKALLGSISLIKYLGILA